MAETGVERIDGRLMLGRIDRGVHAAEKVGERIGPGRWVVERFGEGRGERGDTGQGDTGRANVAVPQCQSIDEAKTVAGPEGAGHLERIAIDEDSCVGRLDQSPPEGEGDAEAGVLAGARP